MAKKTDTTVETTETPAAALPNEASLALIKALVEAINQTKPVVKQHAGNRKPKNPWMPKDGSPKIHLRRKFYQHGILVDPDMVSNETISLMNRVRPGRFLDGHVSVTRRRDRGIDITYPIKTASQRLKLVNLFGIRTFEELLERCILEADNPTKYNVENNDQD